MLKMFSMEEDIPEMLPLKAMAAAYDTMGTNSVHYNLTREFYDRTMSRLLRTPAEIVKDLMDNAQYSKKKINNYVRMSGVNKDQLFDHFPSLKDLRLRHIYDHVKCAYGNAADWEFRLYQSLHGDLCMSSVPRETRGPTLF